LHQSEKFPHSKGKNQQCKDNPEKGRKYLLTMHTTRASYPGYIRDLNSSAPKKEKKIIFNWAIDQSKHMSKEDIQITNRYVKKMINLTNYQRIAN
jgi:hypothetical protein